MKTLKVLLVAAILISVVILAGCGEFVCRPRCEPEYVWDDRPVIREEVYMLRGDGRRVPSYRYIRQ